jgi:uncharacterized protein (TIGR02145 family)
MKIRIAILLLPFLVISCEPENSAPVARFSCYPPEGNIKTLFDLDAGDSYDSDGLKSLLLYRWDFNGDGQWDMPFGRWKIYSCRYSAPGDYEIILEVKDTYNAVASEKFTIHVDSLHQITDPRDGQVYPVVKVGTYWWLGRNLNIGRRVEPTDLLTNNGLIEKYVYPVDDPDSLNGGLYTWSEMMAYGYYEDSQGICPPGWHVPSDKDWNNMLSVFRVAWIPHPLAYNIVGEKWVPDQQVIHDNYRSVGAVWRLLRETGSTGFDIIPLGYRDPDGAFSDRDYYFAGKTATFWTSTMSGDFAIRVRTYQTDRRDGDIFRFADNRRFAFSVRCVKESL